MTDVVLSVYALEECSTYKGIYVDAIFRQNRVLAKGDMDFCLESAYSTYSYSKFIVSTKSLTPTAN